MQIENIILEAEKILMENWPLTSFIATNPFWSLREKDFFEVASYGNINGFMPINYYLEKYKNGEINDENLIAAIKKIKKTDTNKDNIKEWINSSAAEDNNEENEIIVALQIDEYKFQKPNIYIKEKLFSLLRDFFGLAIYKDQSLLKYWLETYEINNLELKTDNLSNNIELLINKIGIPKEAALDYLQTIYLQTFGWGSLMKWRNKNPDNPWLPGNDDCKVLLLIWLYYESIIVAETGVKYKNNQASNSGKANLYIWQTALELNYQQKLDTKLNYSISTNKDQAYDAQFILCIDTRSEGLRRHLEQNGNFQTFGFAGFFGAIFNLKDEKHVSFQAPALVKATHTFNLKKKTSIISKISNKFNKAIAFSKKQYTSPFALFEMVGFWFLPIMLFKSLQPFIKAKAAKNKIKIENTFSFDEKFAAAQNLLKSIGLTNNFAEYVFICAHQSDNINNPYKSSLNCGACGGNSGIPNAIVMCDILNDIEIKTKLNSSGIIIPATTKFIPACHHTGNDRLDILSGKIPEQMQRSIDNACRRLRQEKAASLPGNNSLESRENNWSELIPELGLINNTAIIIAPRELTINKDLARRTFLHSYDPNIDQDGTILTSILSAPAGCRTLD